MDFYRNCTSNLEQLRARYPDQFSNEPNGGFVWPDGWHALVADVCESIAFYSPTLRWLQIKEKFAELRMYYDDGPIIADDVSTMKSILRIDGTFPDAGIVQPLIDRATHKSTETCMGCAWHGTRRVKDGYVYVACDECLKQNGP